MQRFRPSQRVQRLRLTRGGLGRCGLQRGHFNLGCVEAIRQVGDPASASRARSVHRVRSDAMAAPSIHGNRMFAGQAARADERCRFARPRVSQRGPATFDCLAQAVDVRPGRVRRLGFLQSGGGFLVFLVQPQQLLVRGCQAAAAALA